MNLASQLRKPRENMDSPNSYDCEFNCPRNGWIPFTASADDNEFHGRLIYALIVDGLAGEVESFKGLEDEKKPDSGSDSNGGSDGE